ncbi:MAG: hypothetical protein MZV64_42240 [Ignavibacteriales bacterium]|nr:hypothetical protein [Ignavibacteriales bacterium]
MCVGHRQEILVELLFPRNQPELRHVRLPSATEAVQIVPETPTAATPRECTRYTDVTPDPFGPRIPAGLGSMAHAAMSHILIVEDDRDIAELLQRYLTRAGHVTDAARRRRRGARVRPRARARTWSSST